MRDAFYPAGSRDGVAAGRVMRRAAGGDGAGDRRPGELLGAAAHQADRRAPRAGRDARADPALLPDRELPAGHDRHRAGHDRRLRHQPAVDGDVRAAAVAVHYLPVGAVALWLLGQLSVLGPARAPRRCRRRSRPAASEPGASSTLSGMPTLLVIDDNPSGRHRAGVLFSLHDIDDAVRARRRRPGWRCSSASRSTSSCRT
jgi:hypothetical protein